MTEEIKAKIAEGKKYAIGDGVMMDTEKAYRIWREVASYLNKEDRQYYRLLKETLDPEPFFYSDPQDDMLEEVGTASGHHSEDELSLLWQRAFSIAQEQDNYDSLYSILRNYELKYQQDRGNAREMADKPARVKKIERSESGAKLQFLMHQMGLNASLLHYYVEAELGKMTGRSISKQAFYQYSKGDTYIGHEVREAIAGWVNSQRVNVKRYRLLFKRDLTADDLGEYVSLWDFVGLFNSSCGFFKPVTPEFSEKWKL